jgi:hypothetical protein
MTRPVEVVPSATTVVVDDLQPARGRTSWGAVLAGATIALVVTLLLQVLMIWLGMSAIDPAEEARPFQGVGTAAAIGALVTMAIALFVGGIVAGRLANRVNGTDVFLHGLLTWAVVTLTGLWLALTTVGALVSGTLGVVGQTAGAVSQGAAAFAPELTQGLEDLGAELDALTGDAQAELDPLWTEPAARREFRAVVVRIVRDGEPTVSDADRDDLVAVVAENTDLTLAEAEALVDDWVARYEDAQARLAQLEGDLREAGQAASDALGAASMWAFFGLLLGALVTWLGARVGAPSSRPETRRA